MYKQTYFTIGGENDYKGYYIENNTWNGFETPLFEKEEIEKFIKQETSEQLKIEYNNLDDIYIISLYSGNELIDSLPFGSCTIIVNGKARKVYPFGYQYFTWVKSNKQLENKVYIVLDEYYNSVDNHGTEVACVCKTRDEALARRKALVEANLNDDQIDFILDEETQDLEADLVRMFYGCQENWDNYFELEIIESVVE